MTGLSSWFTKGETEAQRGDRPGHSLTASPRWQRCGWDPEGPSLTEMVAC